MRFLQQPSHLIVIFLLCAEFTAAVDLNSAKRAYEQNDYATAFKEASALAEKGNAGAQVLLGKMYLRGRGVQVDPDTALKWFKEAAAQGSADGEFLLGSMYLLPRSNISEGLKWVRLAAEQGNQDAELLLGQTYMDGLAEFPRDPVQGDMWLRLAAKDNLPFYQAQLEAAEKQLSPEQIAKAKELAEAWHSKSATPLSHQRD